MTVIADDRDKRDDADAEGVADETDGSRERKKPKSRKDAVAVALAYVPEGQDAPRVVAGGRGAIAEQIIELAFEHGIKVREDADLAELLSTLDIESEIPLEAFAAVAEILVYVYRANGMLPEILDRIPGGPTSQPPA